ARESCRCQRQSCRQSQNRPAAIQDHGLEAVILQDKPDPRGIGHSTGVIGYGGHGGVESERAERIVPVSGLGKSGIRGLCNGVPFVERYTYPTGSMTGIKRRLGADIEITKRT